MPDGSIVTQRQVVRLPAGFMKTLAAFADVSAEIDLGLHCSRCKQDIRGENHSQSARWTMECECRTFVGENTTVSH
jgi:hypothetical protein